MTTTEDRNQKIRRIRAELAAVAERGAQLAHQLEEIREEDKRTALTQVHPERRPRHLWVVKGLLIGGAGAGAAALTRKAVAGAAIITVATGAAGTAVMVPLITQAPAPSHAPRPGPGHKPGPVSPSAMVHHQRRPREVPVKGRRKSPGDGGHGPAHKPVHHGPVPPTGSPTPAPTGPVPSPSPEPSGPGQPSPSPSCILDPLGLICIELLWGKTA